jgi:hypothetical protein
MKEKIREEINRRFNARRVFINQREILWASKLNKLIFLKPICPPACSGFIEHYYHFIFDLLLPLNILLKKVPSDVVFVFESFGVFTDRLQYLFPGRTRIESESTIPAETKRMNLIGMNPLGIHLTRKAVEHFKNDICNSLGVDQTDNGNMILLIERLPPDQYFIEEATRKGAGASRRSILNHDVLMSTLHSMVSEPFVFHNLQLEKITFREQVNYFSKAKVVLAQHGAGLANCIWMNPRSIVVELNSEVHKNHFSIISKVKQHSYFLYRLSGTHSEIDVENFANWILSDVKLRKFFNSPA